jgi:hypothetical protein
LDFTICLRIIFHGILIVDCKIVNNIQNNCTTYYILYGRDVSLEVHQEALGRDVSFFCTEHALLGGAVSEEGGGARRCEVRPTASSIVCRKTKYVIDSPGDGGAPRMPKSWYLDVVCDNIVTSNNKQ